MIIGEAPTSPIPMKARTTRRKGNPSLAATGVRAVAIDHQSTPNPRTSFPPTVSAHMPPATCHTKLPSSKNNQKNLKRNS